MKRIWSIYATDMRNVGRNWAASVIVLGLIFLPSLYAWFNILASWDPYSNTGSLAIAVVNQDLGTTVNGRELHIGDEIVASLRADHRIGWTFVEAEQAMKGVRRGDYYASLTIPPDFSERIASVLTESPRKAEISTTSTRKSTPLLRRLRQRAPAAFWKRSAAASSKRRTAPSSKS